MPKFNEEFLQFVWQQKLLKPKKLNSIKGREIHVLKPGDLNLDAGPDFSNAQIKIDEILLVGNVEVHIRTSDWLKHKHQQDRSYDTIILHVVYEHDIELDQNKNNNVEVLELKGLVADETIERYYLLSQTKEKLPCHNFLAKAQEINFISWLERMSVERLERKVENLELLFKNSQGNYAQTFYTILLRSFGFKVNALPFELLSKQLPVQILLRHSDDLKQLEALLLGTAGFLEEQYEDKYIQQLQNEYEFLKLKYRLIPLKKELFKFSKLRPANFPSLRLAQLAALIFSNRNLFLKPYELIATKELRKALQIKTSGYWKNHYNLHGRAVEKELQFGNNSVESVLINAFAPFFFFYSKKLFHPQYAQLATQILSDCKVEDNFKTRLFAVKKQNIANAANSQGIIHLYDKYCKNKRCLSCGIGVSFLKNA